MSESKLLLKQIYSLAQEKKAENIKMLNVSNITSIADYFIICSATNPIQLKAIADNISEKIKETPWRKEGYENANWIILDYIDVVVHLFLDETRSYYDLERIWFDAKVVK
jgi:ribosome-associated protein